MIFPSKANQLQQNTDPPEDTNVPWSLNDDNDIFLAVYINSLCLIKKCKISQW